MYMTSTYKYINIEELWYMIYYKGLPWNDMSIAHEHVFVDKHDSPAAPWHGIKNFQEPVCSLYI
jgi:hypothetical protein